MIDRAVYIAIATVLTSGVTLLWLSLALRQVRARRGPRIGTRVLIACCVLVLSYPLGVGGIHFVWRSTLGSWTPMGGSTGQFRWWLAAAAVPAVILAGALWLTLRRAAPAFIALVAGWISGAAALIYEDGTHGAWYVQSEGLALLMTAAIFLAIWHLGAGGGLLWWASRAVWPRTDHCTKCGFPARGLPPGAPCPECGTPRPPVA